MEIEQIEKGLRDMTKNHERDLVNLGQISAYTGWSRKRIKERVIASLIRDGECFESRGGKLKQFYVPDVAKKIWEARGGHLQAH